MLCSAAGAVAPIAVLDCLSNLPCCPQGDWQQLVQRAEAPILLQQTSAKTVGLLGYSTGMYG